MKTIREKANAITRVILVVAVLSLGFGVGMTVAPGARAHDIGYRWYDDSAECNDATSTFSTQIAYQVDAYDDNTDLSVSEGGYPYQITFFDGWYGYNGWDGRATAYNGDYEPCFDDDGFTGDCNTSSDKAEWAVIQFNRTYASNWTTDYKYFLVVHEMGHVFGLDHEPCAGSDSVMQVPADCYSGFGNLQTHDINLLDSWY